MKDALLKLLVVVASVLAAVAVHWAWSALHRLDGVTAFALLGVDNRTDQEAGRSDAILVVLVHREKGKVAVLSLPRDLYVTIPGHPAERINAAVRWGERDKYPGGGLALLGDTLRENLGIDLRGAVSVDFDGFVQIVDGVGGIDVDVPCRVRDALWLESPEQRVPRREVLRLEPGRVHMDGQLALMYSRSRRHLEPLERDPRQQQVLAALMRKLWTVDLVSQIPWLLTHVRTNIETADLVALATLASQLKPRDVRGHALSLGSGEVRRASMDGRFFYELDRDVVARSLERVFDAPPVGELPVRCPPLPAD